MTRLEHDAGEELVCRAGTARLEILTPREVPLGGPRAMRVRRTLPQRERSLIGAWCFVDHYGPDDVAESGGMSVAPHPHTGLQTVSWLFTGEITHRDSAGNHARVLPGEVNLMTAGRGISHSEVSTADTTTLHGAQLWVALPDADRHTDPGFQHYAPPAVSGEGWSARVFLGSLLGSTSPVDTFTPLLGAEMLLEPGARLSAAVAADHEHGLLIDRGEVVVATPGDGDGDGAGEGDRDSDGARVAAGELGYLPPGLRTLDLTAGPDGARLLVLGGPPFGEEIVMWWNFVGRTHEEVVGFRQDWQDQIATATDGQDVTDGRFGIVLGEHLPPIPAPNLPNARLRTRG